MHFSCTYRTIPTMPHYISKYLNLNLNEYVAGSKNGINTTGERERVTHIHCNTKLAENPADLDPQACFILSTVSVSPRA